MPKAVFDQPFPKFLFDDDAPETLYHYTSSAGLVGIIESSEIWATKTTYLNDSSELKLAFDYIRDEIEIRKKEIINEQYSFDYGDMLFALDGLGDRDVNVSVASFSANGDQLSQWRGYSKIGDGYSIGFDGKRLKQHISSLTNGYGEHFYFMPCQYDPGVHKKIVSELIDYSLTPKDQGYNLPEDDDHYGEMYQHFQQNVLIISQIIKSETFKEENEWRLISPNLSYSNAKFRIGKHSLIPYWEIYLDLVYTLKSIIIGPTVEPSLSFSALRGFLQQQGQLRENINIENSKIPFRII